MVKPGYAGLMLDKHVGVIGIVAKAVGAASKRGKIVIHGFAGWPVRNDGAREDGAARFDDLASVYEGDSC